MDVTDRADRADRVDVTEYFLSRSIEHHYDEYVRRTYGSKRMSFVTFRRRYVAEVRAQVGEVYV